MTQEIFTFAESDHSTPMMKQYFAIKAEYKDTILFYRMGDFYEMFFEDAIIGAKILNIALTKRGKHETQDIPMCGIPFHSSESYLHKLINAGYKVAICEQTESPEQAKKRGYKAVVNREVVRVVTPGTIIEDSLLNAKSSNYLVSITLIDNKLAIAWLDISTGEFATINSNINSLGSEIARLSPKEILIAEKLLQDVEIAKILADWKRILTVYTASFFDIMKAENKMRIFYQVATIESFGELSKPQIAACGSILEYISVTQKQNIPKLKPPKIIKNDLFMCIDYATRRNLELTSNLSGNSYDTLMSVIDKTLTSMGGRLLSHYISSPLMDVNIINKRLNLVEFFCCNQPFNTKIRDILPKIADLERAISRLSINYGGPRDLIVIRNSLMECGTLAQTLQFSGIEVIPEVMNFASYLTGFSELINELLLGLRDEAPLLARDGGFIKENYNPKLDELYSIRDNSKFKLAELKTHYIKISGVQNLKIIHNNVLGYFIEVTPQHASKLDAPQFIHRQSLANAVRFTTNDLKQLENDIINSKELILNLELELFTNLKNMVVVLRENILLTANSVANIDVASTLAKVAGDNKFVRPLIDNSNEFNVVKARHPVVEQSLKQKNNEDFIANDCYLGNKQKIWLITGPNMAGKSTFLRQNALIAILAQIGSFVPAESAHIGIIDRVFSRVGAADDLARNRSTFMVEMVETAIILNQATVKSLVILDEIGRGTSTYDGVAIAWSCLEYIHNNIGCRSLFATHYHELTNLEHEFSELKCYSAAVKEWEGKVIFLHQIIAGSTDRSYGIHVAMLAGIPSEVINRAHQILQILESKDKDIDIAAGINIIKEDNGKTEKLISYLNNIDINTLTPIEALNHLVKLKQLITLK